MGAKITIDSSTLMNKGLEVIEAKYLFDVSEDNIEVVVHRKSIVHSMVQFKDGTIMASLGPKSMEIPIAYALNYPNRLENDIQKLNLFDIRDLTFERPDTNKFKCLKLAYEAIKMGHSYQVVLNAANEVLVDKFLHDEIGFTDIPNNIEKMLNSHNSIKITNINDVIELDKEIRQKLTT
jgi:1-deoxy-D-xylulose-5-phosphate reductoisomerase